MGPQVIRAHLEPLLMGFPRVSQLPRTPRGFFRAEYRKLRLGLFEASGCRLKIMINPDISADDDLESRIELQASLLREDRSPGENKATWLELTRLHRMRSPEKVAQMEREKNLR